MTIAAPLPTQPSSTARIALPALFAVLGILGMTAAWVIVALILDRQCAWMAAIAAADIALLMRLGRAAPGPQRASVTLLATALTIMIANWWIASTHIGVAMGFGLIDSAYRLGTHYAWTLAGLANQGSELAWYAVAMAIAYWLGK
jgi:hypothetical protein